MTTLLLVGGGVLFSFLISMMGYIIYLATRQGELKEKLEDDEIEIEAQNKYLEIAGRPSVDPDVILERMRRETTDK